MNITLNIPVNNTFHPVQLKELQQELTNYAMTWIAKLKTKESICSENIFDMPKEFDALRGSVNLEKLEAARKNDIMLDAIMEKYK